MAITPIVRQQGPAVDRITGLPGAELDIAFAECPGHRIELMQYLAPAGRADALPRPCDPGFAHVAFEVDDIDATVAALAAGGYPPVNPPEIVPAGPRKGGKNVYLYGPAGVALEFQQAPPGAKINSDEKEA